LAARADCTTDPRPACRFVLLGVVLDVEQFWRSPHFHPERRSLAWRCVRRTTGEAMPEAAVSSVLLTARGELDPFGVVRGHAREQVVDGERGA
jgi:hypothetical protein